MAQLRLVFMGTADIAAPALKALVAAGHEIACVYTRPPRPAGRGQRERRTAIHDAAEAMGLAVRHPKSLKDADARKGFAALNADAAVVMAYGLILPGAVLDAPRLGCINIHASLLPRWRGAAPIQRAILAGDAETGVTIMQMDEGLDTGDMLLRGAVPIGPDMTAGALHDALAALGARLIVEALDRLAAGTLTPTPQPAEGATYAQKLDRDESRLDWREDAAALERRVRAFDPWPGAWFAHGDARIRVAAAAVAPARPGAAPGTVLDDAPTVACGDGALRLLRLQRPGRAAMDAAAFLRGYALPPGTVLP
jgi:methionyl-tRNA formyltransferase